MIILLIMELQSINSGLEYRYQYLIILYLVAPALFLTGLLEYIGLRKLIDAFSITMLFPFIIATAFVILILQEGRVDILKISYLIVGIELLFFLLLAYRLKYIVNIRL